MIAVAVGTAAAGCKKADPLYCRADRPCLLADEFPFCDVSGQYEASEGRANTCIPCEPGAFLRCGDDEAEMVLCDAAGGGEVTETCGSPGCNESAGRCNECAPGAITCDTEEMYTLCGADGLVADESPCPLGCHESGCYQLVPSTLDASYLDLARDGVDLVLTDGSVIDTGAGTVRQGNGEFVDINGFTVDAAPFGGVYIFVLPVRSLSAGDVVVVGHQALAILSDGPVTISGTISLQAGGPGAVARESGACDEAQSGGETEQVEGQLWVGGGGGGGFGQPGGDGGGVDASALGGAPGSISGSPELVPLRGGCAGGVGGSIGEDLAAGGGGALQITSATSITIGPGGFIDAPGSGGTAEARGAGGGSGGAILLEAPTVSIAAAAGLTANGGGGACLGASGELGTRSLVAATGGQCAEIYHANGGSGGTATGDASLGETAEIEDGPELIGGGGGGGGVGRIRINTRTGDFTVSGTSMLSPMPSVGTVAIQ